MKPFTISVKKLTDINLMREACEMTFLGTSKQSLLSIYKSEHSPVRTQLFWVKLEGIPLFISTHLLRHHVGSVPFQLTCRDDRKGGNPGLISKIEDIKTQLNQALSMEPEEREEAVNKVIQQLDWIANNSDRYTPVNLGLLLNAQSLIDMAKLRLCTAAHAETIQVFKALKAEIDKIDPELAAVMVRKCVYRGGLCGEPLCCGFNSTPGFKKEIAEYLKNFNAKQIGLIQISNND